MKSTFASPASATSGLQGYDLEGAAAEPVFGSKTLYVSRPLKNADDLIAWATEQGFSSTLEADDIHVTIAFSRSLVDWDALTPDAIDLLIAPDNGRTVKALGDKGAVVLTFDSPMLSARFRAIVAAGASWDFPEYQAHVTITYAAPQELSLKAIDPYSGVLLFGPELFAELDDKWTDNVSEVEAAKGADLDRKETPMAKSALSMFIPLTKVDAEKRLVYGIATAEKVDRENEICDYESTKPLYEAWSAEISKNTDGKSLGNVRAMHGNIAAGKVTTLNFNDKDKQIEICAKIVDDGEWNKVIEGVYTGFSQGGSFQRRWKDPENAELTRFTAKPAEVSLVDLPCLPEATFDMIRGDGVIVHKHFKSVVAAQKHPDNDSVLKRAGELAKAAGKTDPAEFIEPARNELIEKLNAPAIGAEIAAVVVPPVNAEDVGIEQVWKATDGTTHKTKAAAIAHASEVAAKAAAARTTAPVTDLLKTIKAELDKRALPLAGLLAKLATPAVREAAGVSEADVALLAGFEKSVADDARASMAFPPLGEGDAVSPELKAAIGQAVELIRKAPTATDLAKADYTAEQRKAMATSGAAMKDGSFPIATKADLENAITLQGKSKNPASAKRHIIRRAKALKATDSLPADWPGSTKTAKADKLAKMAGDELKKYASLYGLANIVQLLASIESAEESLEYASWDGGSVTVSKEVQDRFGSVVVELGDIAAEILDALVSAMRSEEYTEAMALAAPALTMIKVGARHSANDTKLLQSAHDTLSKLGAACDMGAAKEAGAGDLAKITGERDALIKEVGGLKPLLDDVLHRVKAIEAQPATTEPRRFTVVDKKAGNGGALDLGDGRGAVSEEAVLLKLASMDREQIAELMIKIAQQRPIRMAMQPG